MSNLCSYTIFLYCIIEERFYGMHLIVIYCYLKQLSTEQCNGFRFFLIDILPILAGILIVLKGYSSSTISSFCLVYCTRIIKLKQDQSNIIDGYFESIEILQSQILKSPVYNYYSVLLWPCKTNFCVVSKVLLIVQQIVSVFG